MDLQEIGYYYTNREAEENEFFSKEGKMSSEEEILLGFTRKE